MTNFKNIALKFGLWVSTGLVVSALLTGPSLSGENCTCRANGKDFKEGQIICLRLPSGPQMSRCESVLNNTSWKKLGDGCPSASLKEMPKKPSLSAPANQSRLTKPVSIL